MALETAFFTVISTKNEQLHKQVPLCKTRRQTEKPFIWALFFFFQFCSIICRCILKFNTDFLSPLEEFTEHNNVSDYMWKRRSKQKRFSKCILSYSVTITPNWWNDQLLGYRIIFLMFPITAQSRISFQKKKNSFYLVAPRQKSHLRADSTCLDRYSLTKQAMQ